MIASSLLDEVRPLAERFVGAGFRVYLVGGIVRDQLLGRPLSGSSDIDLTTDATPESIKRVVGPLADALWTQGERFGTIGCRIGTRDFEITTHRGESYEPSSRKPEVTFSSELLHDLERRDFTVNAMAVELPDGRLFDPFGGARDLGAHVLRTPLAPEVSFSDDPLRMLRAARFIAGYGLVADEGIIDAIRSLASRMTIVSVERRRDELDKLICVADPSEGLRFLRQHELLAYMVPALADIDRERFDRTLEALGRLPRVRDLRLAGLFLFAGLSRSDVETELRRFRYGNDVVSSVGAVVHGATFIASRPTPWSAPDVRRLVSAIGRHVDAAITVASTFADTTALRDELQRLRAAEDLDALEPALDGDDVMRILDVGPGADVGRAIAFLHELRITDGVLTPAAAERRLIDWWNAQQAS